MLDKGIKDILNNKKKYSIHMNQLSNVPNEIHDIVSEVNKKIIALREQYNLTNADLFLIQTIDGLVGFSLNMDKINNGHNSSK